MHDAQNRQTYGVSSLDGNENEFRRKKPKEERQYRETRRSYDLYRPILGNFKDKDRNTIDVPDGELHNVEQQDDKKNG